MTERISTGRIREIIIYDKMMAGNDPYRVVVGNKVPAGKKRVIIEEIVRDENAAVLFGCLRYIIYVVNEDDPYGDPFPWKTFENLKTEVIHYVE